MADLPDDIHFLDLNQVREIHQSQLDLHGGSAGLRDEGLLRSALSQPEASFGGKWLHANLHEMASAYLFSLVSNHPFVDGNKRVGAVATVVFLRMNGLVMDVDQDVYAELVLAVASGKATRDDVVTFLRAHSSSLDE
jgi:death on curing protein